MLRDDITKLRQSYSKATLLEKDAKANAIEQFDIWFNEGPAPRTEIRVPSPSDS